MQTNAENKRTRRPLGDVSNRNPANVDNGKGGNVGVKKRVVKPSNVNNVHVAVDFRQNVEVAPVMAPVRAPVRSAINNNSSNMSIIRNPFNASSYQYSGPADDIDARDADDALCVTSYVQDMYDHHRSREASTSVRPTYMINHQHISERMRAILIDWLVEVHNKFKMVPETLYLTVNILDRYLVKNPDVMKGKLQLVGVTALLIASKYEEIYPPELRDLVYICDRAYNQREILDMETTILRSLQYQITIPSAHAFLVRYLKAAHADKKIVQLSCFILDGTLQSYSLLGYLPSQLAAAAVFIARRTSGRNAWSPTLLKYAEYSEEEIMPVARAVLAEKSSTTSDLRAVNRKYSSSRYGSVADTSLDCGF